MTTKGSAAAKRLCFCAVVDAEEVNVMIINRRLVSFHFLQGSLLAIEYYSYVNIIIEG